MIESKRWFALFSMIGLTVIASVSAVVYASSIGFPPPGWETHSVDQQVTFAYPSNFVAANDGFPNVQIAGGALLDSNKMNYELLLGVEINQTPNITVNQEASHLIQTYGKSQLAADQFTSLGRELMFHLADNSTYTVILSPLSNGLREILINNEHSNPQFDPLIHMFLSTVHNATTVHAT